MDRILTQIKTKVYDPCALEISCFNFEKESKEYDASQFKLNGIQIINRNAKITPKKVGQFVTFWKRSQNGPIVPFHENDPFKFFTVNVQTNNQLGQFVFPKSVLIEKGIISTNHKEGKRAFRVYPSWDVPKSKQAERTQKWQLDFFYHINESIDFDRVKELYGTE
ncbi:MAG: MepB family protein [Balneola sp.]|uniref:MepB family protein n=1 Tax=Bacteroidota TaxID=976 RepID=UPI0032649B38